MNLFGKKKMAGPPPNPADAIIKLRGTMETLTKREAYIQKKMEMMIVEAKGKMARKDRNGALFALKKKKMYEAEVTKIQGAMMNLESQAMSLEGSATNMEVFGAMRYVVSSFLPSLPSLPPSAEECLGCVCVMYQRAMMILESQAMSFEGSATSCLER